jgi:hypothetical protein
MRSVLSIPVRFSRKVELANPGWARAVGKKVERFVMSVAERTVLLLANRIRAAKPRSASCLTFSLGPLSHPAFRCFQIISDNYKKVVIRLTVVATAANRITTLQELLQDGLMSVI